ncbi:MAG: hypothetical protein EOO61_17990 [Hymenobacter sp.]|nr:MAG: hypothetical protein EOO61_17990 [Hymenobacter sp.]
MKKVSISSNYYSYRITKFNPKNRNEQGVYLDISEWTAISDIGKPSYNSPTYEEYERIESAYVAAIETVLLKNAVSSLKVDSLEIHSVKENFEHYKLEGRLQSLTTDFEKDIAGLRNGIQLDSSQLRKTIRLILREVIWMVLSSKEVTVEFGYDYYIYVRCKKLNSNAIKQIEKTGLFIEQLNS